jgi:hypothetical protein
MQVPVIFFVGLHEGDNVYRIHFEKFSDRLKGFVQSAQTLAIREGNPQITPEHLLKVLLDDPEGLPLVSLQLV